MRPRISIRGLVRPSVGWSVRNAFVKIDDKWPFTECTVTDEEERGTSRKERRGGRSDKETEKKIVKKKKWLEDASLTSAVLLLSLSLS